MSTSSLPPDDVIAEGWARVADALVPASAAWEAVSPDTTGPVAELLRHARWNATVWTLKSQGVARMEAWRAADAEHGPVDRRYIDFEPDDDNDEGPFT
ncbi:hypothetical protein [Mycolicibacterium porcinum]|uniref:Mycothiol-dependent maleylpyruvate isomerase metal-binding domain-containing protein n=1 Tax=Mycolicibacterium porcinum TaxID=39693 RepID=A0ABV3VJH3_9MYCO